MKTMFLLTAISLLALTEGSTTRSAPDSSAEEGPVTVHVTYRVQRGKEVEFKAMVARAWEVYRRDNLTLAEPHILLQGVDENSLPRFIEIFSWASRSIAEHPTTNVWKVWNDLHMLCEFRGTNSYIRADKVKLLVPSAK